jgi:hypothetical protein
MISRRVLRSDRFLLGRRLLVGFGCAALFTSLLGSPARGAEGDDLFSVRRFLLSAGSDHGGAGREELRFADTDAKAMSKVFTELGGVDPTDQILLLDADPATFRRSLAQLRQRMEQAGREHNRVELIVYYSGHSDELGLLLDGEMLSYQELRKEIDDLPADVRIIVLDSCASGAFNRLKGGARRAPFLLDTSTKLQGHAFLTSSSHDEAAQESDRLGGSYFTTALLTGLRGAADVTQDHRVTLNEAYQFAYQNTLSRTEGTLSGPQHPGYDIQMVGAGDLVMTDLRSVSAGLVLTEELEGRLHVRDDQDCLVIELQKPRGRAIELGLDPGDYRVYFDRDGSYLTTKITLTDGGLLRLNPADLQPMAAVDTRARGEFPEERPVKLSEGEIIRSPFVICLWPGMTNNRLDEARTVAELSFNLTFGRNYGVDGVEVGTLANWNLNNVDGVQISGGVNLVEGSVDGMQYAGLINQINHQAKVIQWAGLANSVSGDLEGIQGAGVFNLTRGDCHYLQIAGTGNAALSEMRGVQVAGAGNYSRTLSGTQVAGAVNLLRGASSGAQIAGAVNLVDGDFRGTQVSGACNCAPSLRGLQLSVVNVCGSTEGAQIGVVNVARKVRGAQVGLINVADEVSGAPVGMVSLVRRGRHQIAAWSSDTSPFNVGLELGNQHVYSILAAGAKSSETKDRRFAGCGLGLEIPFGRFFGQVEAVSYQIFEPTRALDRKDGDLHLLNKGTLGFGWQAAPRFALVGGMSVNVFTSQRGDGDRLVGGRASWHTDRNGPTFVRVWPGFYLGARI